MGWRGEGRPSKLEKIVGALEMGAGGAMIGFMFSPWGDKYLPAEAKPYWSLLGAGLIAYGRANFHGQRYEADNEHQHGISHVHAKAREHEPKIRAFMEKAKSIADYVLPKVQAYNANRAYAR